MGDIRDVQQPVLPGRSDARPDPLAGRDAIHLYCACCGCYRGTYSLELLPPPGPCARCRAADPRTYWTRDWPHEGREA